MLKEMAAGDNRLLFTDPSEHCITVSHAES
jgi:hypothetical protein